MEKTHNVICQMPLSWNYFFFNLFDFTSFFVWTFSNFLARCVGYPKSVTQYPSLLRTHLWITVWCNSAVERRFSNKKAAVFSRYHQLIFSNLSGNNILKSTKKNKFKMKKFQLFSVLVFFLVCGQSTADPMIKKWVEKLKQMHFKCK